MFTNTVELNSKIDIADVNSIIQRVNGVWSAMSTGLLMTGSSYPCANAMVIDPNDGTLYVGGYFDSAGGDTDCNYIAKWDGNSFSPLDVGLEATVFCLALAPNGDLYAGGQFDDEFGEGGNALSKIARWDGSSWNALDVGLNNIVWSMGFDSNGLLYVGGAFDCIFGGVANSILNIATWDGTNFAELGNGVNDYVRSLCIDSQNNVYIAGVFTEADGDADCTKACYWNGSAWQNMGTNTGRALIVTTLAIDPADIVYASGLFTEIAGVTALNIAMWNNTQWFPLGLGIAGEAWTLTPLDRSLLLATGEWTKVYYWNEHAI